MNPSRSRRAGQEQHWYPAKEHRDVPYLRNAGCLIWLLNQIFPVSKLNQRYRRPQHLSQAQLPPAQPLLSPREPRSPSSETPHSPCQVWGAPAAKGERGTEPSDGDRGERGGQSQARGVSGGAGAWPRVWPVWSGPGPMEPGAWPGRGRSRCPLLRRARRCSRRFGRDRCVGTRCFSCDRCPGGLPDSAGTGTSGGAGRRRTGVPGAAGWAGTGAAGALPRFCRYKSEGRGGSTAGTSLGQRSRSELELGWAAGESGLCGADSGIPLCVGTRGDTGRAPVLPPRPVRPHRAPSGKAGPGARGCTFPCPQPPALGAFVPAGASFPLVMNGPLPPRASLSEFFFRDLSTEGFMLCC